MPCLMPCPCTETDAKHFADSVTETYTDSRFTFAKCFPNECLNVGCDFEETFADAYPNDIESRNSGTHKDLSCNEEVLDCIKFHNNKKVKCKVKRKANNDSEFY